MSQVMQFTNVAEYELFAAKGLEFIQSNRFAVLPPTLQGRNNPAHPSFSFRGYFDVEEQLGISRHLPRLSFVFQSFFDVNAAKTFRFGEPGTIEHRQRFFDVVPPLLWGRKISGSFQRIQYFDVDPPARGGGPPLVTFGMSGNLAILFDVPAISNRPYAPECLFEMTGPTAGDQTFDVDPPLLAGRFAADCIFEMVPDGVAPDFDEFVYLPLDYEKGFRETLSFRTDLLQGETGKEQRIRSRYAPRQVFELLQRVDAADESARLRALLYSTPGQMFGVPVLSDAVPLGVDISPDDVTVYANVTQGDFRADSIAVVIREDGTYELLRVDSVHTNYLSLAAPAQELTLAAGTLLAPVRLCKNFSPVSVSVYATGVQDFTLQLTSLSDRSYGEVSAFPSYLGYPVFDLVPTLSSNARSDGLAIISELFETAGGVDLVTGFSKYQPTSMLRVKCSDAATAWTVRKFFHYLAGRQRAFFLPTRTNDLELVANVSNNSSTIDVTEIGFIAAYGSGQPDHPRRCVQIVRTSGVVSRHEILGCSSPSAGVERLTLSPAVTPALTTTGVRRIEFLELCRLGSDDVAVEHPNGYTSIFEAPVTGVQE